MAATTGERPVASTAGTHGPAMDSPVDAAGVRFLCPYLETEKGLWRSAFASKDHRCGAVDPPALLTVEKQRALCLRPEHERCATYLAAAALHRRPDAPESPSNGSLWNPARTAPVVLEPRRRIGPVPRPTTRVSQVALGGLMVAALGTVIAARVLAPPAVPASSPSGSLPAVVATASPSPTATPTPTPSPSPTPAPTPAPKTYKVKSGDTLSRIARRYGVTIGALREANGLTSDKIKVGQVLTIPPKA